MKIIKQEQKIVVGYELITNNENFKEYKNKDKNINLEEFVEKYNKVLNLIKKSFFADFSKNLLAGNSENKKTGRNKFQIHKEFIRKFLNKDIKIKRDAYIDLSSYVSDLKNIILEQEENIKKIENFILLNLNEQVRKIEISSVIKNIFSKKGLYFFDALFKENNLEKKDKSKIENFDEIRKELNYLMDLENSFEWYFATENGVNIFNGSLNYFSVNKKPNEFNLELEKIEEEMNKKIYEFSLKNKKTNISTILNTKIDKKYFEGFFAQRFEKLKLWEAREFLKKVKAGEKKRFEELLNKEEIKNHDDLKNKIPLFRFEEDKEDEKNQKNKKETCILNNFLGLVQSIKDENYKNQKNKSKEFKVKIKDLSKKKGKYIDCKRGFECFPEYCKLISLYEEIALKYGQLKAKKRAIEMENERIRKLNHWLVLVEKGDEKRILAIPRKSDNLENLKKAKEFLEDRKENKDGEYKILILKSFTLKALKKLLFREGSTFKIENELEEAKDVKIRYLQSRTNTYNLKINEKELVKFYQKVLKSNLAKKSLNLNFENLDEVLNKKFNTEEEFRIAFEKIAYRFEEVFLLKEEYEDFIKNFDVKEFGWTNKSFNWKKDNKEVTKTHKKYFYNFWKERNIRINPEIRFFVKLKDDEFNLEEKAKGKFKRHRLARDRLIVKITYELNVPSQKIKTSFQEKEDILREIDKFNQEFNKQDFKDYYYFGIDKGTGELVSLGIYRNFKKKDNGINYWDSEKIKVYKLKDDFINDENLKKISQKNWIDENLDKFEEKELDYLDLTFVKLIDGKIILNADIKTYFKASLIYLKKRIFDLVEEIDFSLDEYLMFKKVNEENKKIILKTTRNHDEGKEGIGFYKEIYSKIEGGSEDEFKNELLNFIDFAKKIKTRTKEQKLAERIVSGKNESLEFEKINNYKRALASNSIGILNFLMEKFDNKVIFGLENLSRKTTEKQLIKQNAFAIHRNFEWALLNLLRKKNLVPEKINQQIILRELKEKKNKDKYFQIGNILFVPAGGTSTKCPKCDNKKFGYSDEEFKKLKFGGDDKIKCKKCCSEFKADEIACINIADLAYKNFNKN